MPILRKVTIYSLSISALCSILLILSSCQKQSGTPLSTPEPTPTRTKIVLPSAIPSSTSAPTIVPQFTSQYTPAPGYAPSATETPLDEAPLWSSEPVEIFDQLFLVVQYDIFAYRVYLYDVKTGILKERDIDLAETGWNLALHESHYNPNDGEIILTVGRNVWDADGGPITPPGAPPRSPFGFAVYKTDFDPQSDLETVYQDEGAWYSNTVLNIHMNTLVMTRVKNKYSQDVQGEILTEEIWELDLVSSEIIWLKDVPFSNRDRDLIEVSAIQISPQGEKAYQLLLYEGRSEKKEYSLEVMALDLEDSSVQFRLLYRGAENVWHDFSIYNLKPDDLSNGILRPLYPPENSIAWSLTYHFVACKDGLRYYIYDTYDDSIIETGINDYAVVSAQWR